MSSAVKTSVIWMALLGALAALVSCKKDPGAESREAVEEAGYQLDQPAFFRAAESDDLKVLGSMIDGGMEVVVRDATGRTALHAAAGSGAMKAMDFLLDRGVGIDVRDEKERTPLMEAVVRSTPETVRYLLRQGSDPRARDKENYKPLMLAVKEGRSEMVEELAPYVREDLDDSLFAAAIFDQADVIDELTNFGASIYARLGDGRTPLMVAAERGRDDAVDMLLAIGANRFAMDGEGRMASDFAREAGHEELSLRLAGEPREGDFELSEPAELGGEMMAEVMEEDGAPESPDAPPGGDAGVPELADAGEATSDGGGEDALASNTGDDEIPAEIPVVGEGDGGVADGSSGGEERDAVVAALEGAVVGVEGEDAPPAVTGEDAPAPIVMRSYRERELPLRVESTSVGAAVLKVAGDKAVEVPEGEVIPGSQLKVIRVEQRMASGKDQGGGQTEISVVTVEDTQSGVDRELVVGLPALAHDPVALVEDAAGGTYYIARTGQRFRAVDGREFIVGDVRPNQVVIEEMATGETTTLRLRGPRG